MLKEIGGVLGLHVSREELSPDGLYKYDCVWREVPEHGPLKGV